MTKSKKDTQEEKFLNEILKVGVKSVARMHDCGHDYYCFWLINNTQRYWTDMSEENLAQVYENIKQTRGETK